MAEAAEHALADVDAVRTGMRRDGVSDGEVLRALELMVSLQRQVNGTVSVLMAAAEARHAAEELLLTAAERLPADKLRAMTDVVLDQVAPEAKDTGLLPD
ncbi:MAG TPA: hypothetical protein VF349_00125, partial [Candidatus Limnocylindrales bacterium]